MSYRIITISRQFGSGGRTIGKELAAKLGIPCYDQEIIQKIAQESGFDLDYVNERVENAPNAWRFGNLMADRGSYGYSTMDELWRAQRAVILDLAEKGPCIIVGRCADFILRDRDDMLSVFVHADKAWRAQRIVEVYGESDDAPEKRLKDKDKRRKAYYELYTDAKWGEATRYEVCLDSGKLGIETCVELLAGLAKG